MRRGEARRFCIWFPAPPKLAPFMGLGFSPDSEAMGFLLQITMSCPCALSRQVAGAGRRCWCWCCELAVRAVETGCWRRCWCWEPGAGAGCAGAVPCMPGQSIERCRGSAGRSLNIANHFSLSPPKQGNKPPLAAVKGASDNEAPAVMARMNLRAQHHTVLSLERSLSISTVGYLHSSGSVLADSCVKGCTVCEHIFVRIMFYAQRQALNRPWFQHVSACYTHNSRAGYCLALGE